MPIPAIVMRPAFGNNRKSYYCRQQPADKPPCDNLTLHAPASTAHICDQKKHCFRTEAMLALPQFLIIGKSQRAHSLTFYLYDKHFVLTHYFFL